MKTFVILVLAAVLWADRAQSLRCYQCMITSEDSTCQVATCPFPQGLCVTQDVETAQGSVKVKMKNKFCALTCPEGNLEGSIMGANVVSKIDCCDGDLCNAGVPVGVSAWTLAGGLLLGLGLVRLFSLP
ncbi:lymphocyte antigen 6B-like [Perognathus longimembris pacificus]|uniref:lymphocyte antigen 6B-like n=1 Tax=Perognathus longimembris pacificus TaxID=214514 RepID=UPI002019F606|nr:lymphocyte antigen 6B-like [Perognathus longimembris pacificus]